MVFSDLFFLFVFIPAFAVLYMLAGWLEKKLGFAATERRNTLRNAVLVVFSLIFYAWGEPVYVLLLLLCVLLNYLAGRVIGSSRKHRKLALVGGLAVNVGILCVFKYLNFLASVLRDCGLDVGDPKISLPIGISFYVFQSISYLVDVYRRESAPQRSFWGLLLYISMFPQLIAGPIVRYNTVAREIRERHVTTHDVSEGIFRFIIGLGKKVIIANQLGEIATNLLAGGLQDLSVAGAWIGIGAYTLQIYFDFSGYSDMAIGIGRCLGFHFCENFDHPYIAKTITEFWRRWHMSLGSFFRDYVYIPLGGNRRNQMLNILIVWFLTGMWHGASWNFIVWGLYFGLILVGEKYTINRIKDRVPAALLHVYTIFVIVCGFGIFYFDDFSKVGEFFSVAFGLASRPLTDFVSTNLLFEKFWLILAAIVCCMPVRQVARRATGAVVRPGSDGYLHAELSAKLVITFCVIVISVALLVGATNNAFLYTRF